MISTSKSVQLAISLLREAPYKCKIGAHDTDSCPIATAYHIEAVSSWGELKPNYKAILKKYGWTQKPYESFIAWYDTLANKESIEYKKECYDYLRDALKKVKKTTQIIEHRRRRKRRMMVHA